MKPLPPSFLPAAIPLLSAVLSLSLAGAPAREWPLVRGDAAMTGQSTTALRFPLSLGWSVQVGDKAKREGVVATPVTHEGKVFVGAQNGKFACIDLASGKALWAAEKNGFFEGSAAWVDGLVIAGCGDGFVYAWKAGDGSEAWKFETEGEIHAGVNVWKDGTGKSFALIGSYDNRLYCLEASSGRKVWDFETANYVNGAVAIHEGRVAFGGCDGMLYVIEAATGKEIRRIEINSYIGNNIAADAGIAYVAHYGHRVEAFALGDGRRLWEFAERDFEYYAAPAVAGDWVVAGCRDKRVYGLDRATGERKWVFRARGDVDSSPVICAGAHVIFGSNDGFFYAASLGDGAEVWRYEIGAPVKAAPAVAGDWILVGADDGVVYAFKNANVK